MNRKPLRSLSGLLIAVSFLAPVQAQEWTRFHGSGGSAAAPGIPAKFGEADFAWKADLPGNGVSSPVAWGQRIFLTSETEGGGRALLCYGLESGKLLWRLDDKFASHGKHRFNSFASSTPVVDAERVYLTWTSGGSMLTLAADHEGRKQWQVDLGPYAEDHGSGASPVLAGGVLVVSKDSVGADGFLAGLDPDDGRILWRVARKSDRTPFSTPVAFEESPGQWRVIFSSNPAALTCLDPATGKVVWQHDNPQPEQRPVSSPVIANGICFATVGQGGKANAAVAVRTKDGSLAWEGGKGLPYVPTPASAGKHFFLLSDGGILSAVEAASGKQIWSERVFSDQAYSSPVHTGDRIVCISRSGKVAIVAANPESFQLLGSSELSDPCDATPAIAGGRLVIRTARRLLCLTGSRAQP